MLATLQATYTQTFSAAARFLLDGGPSIWAIFALSVLGLTLALWKTWRFILIGAWSRRGISGAMLELRNGNTKAALSLTGRLRGVRGRFLFDAIEARRILPVKDAKDETARIAKRHLASAASGLRLLELVSTIAPLLGLLGTVLGMIAAFQALQESGSRADPAILAGGIWEALLTTAAGMAVAIPASFALTWFESVVDSLRRDLEDIATQVFVIQQEFEPSIASRPDNSRLAAE
ncbi:MotA/TolQ/ExbB proton channel family protein [Neptunicoccus cionae]|uniref:Biopolymer transporter ExbB n=1 Tax=Neptunicoccus cionae TaxID=2035344 RepID=A0A916VQZ2_9RHOB|nr:MotA/TolQ/ExbB proton channel family protein [Amylibacter cionae]GGA20121.1 biopolymer transporter ExbB [Amylibacter cionae]